MAKYFDDGLFASDNEQLSPEVKAEKGGIFTQLLKEADSPILERAMAVVYDKLLSEGSGLPTINSGNTNEYMDRYDKAQAAYPNRDESWWKEIADNRQIQI